MICMFNFSCLFTFTYLYLLLNSYDRDDALSHHSMLVKQSSSFSRKHRTLSLQICVCQTVQLTTESVHWYSNVCTLYKHLFAISAAVTSDFRQRFIDTWASISQNVIDEAVGQWSMKSKGHHFEHLLNWNPLFSEPTHYTTSSQSHQQSTEENTFPSQLFKSK